MPNLSLGNSGSSARRGRKSTSSSTPSSSARLSGKGSKPVAAAPAQFAGLSVFHGLVTLSNPRIGGTSQTYVFDAKICFEGMESGQPLHAVLSYYNKQKLKFYPNDSIYCFIVARLSSINPNDSLELYRVTDSGQRTTSCAGVHLVGDIDKLIYLMHKGEDDLSDEEDGSPSNLDVIVIDNSDDEDAGAEDEAKDSDDFKPIFPPHPGCPKFSIKQPVVFSVSGVASNCNSSTNTFSIITEPFISLIPRGDAAVRKARLPFEFYFSDQGRYRKSEKKPMPWDNKFVTVVGTLTHVVWGKNNKVVQLKLDIDNIVFLGSYGPDSQPQPTVISNTLDPKTPAASKDTSKVTAASSSSSGKAKGKGKALLTNPQTPVVTFPVVHPAASAATTMLSTTYPSPSAAVGNGNDQLIISNEMLQQYLNAAVASRLSALPTPPTPPPFYVPPQHPAASLPPAGMQRPYIPPIAQEPAHQQHLNHHSPLTQQHPVTPHMAGSFLSLQQFAGTPPPVPSNVHHQQGQLNAAPALQQSPVTPSPVPPNAHHQQGNRHQGQSTTPAAITPSPAQQPPTSATTTPNLGPQKENEPPRAPNTVQPPPGAALIKPSVPFMLGGPSVQAMGASVVNRPPLSMALRSAAAPPQAQASGHKPVGEPVPEVGEASGLKRPRASQGGSGRDKVPRTD